MNWYTLLSTLDRLLHCVDLDELQATGVYIRDVVQPDEETKDVLSKCYKFMKGKLTV